VTQKTNPESGREKLVALTDAGREYFDEMVNAGLDYFSELFPHLSDQELREGLQFLSRAFGSPALVDKSHNN
jgi:DNA-binding MarR family transcriptional regulator